MRSFVRQKHDRTSRIGARRASAPIKTSNTNKKSRAVARDFSGITGFEPVTKESKSFVLPLHYIPACPILYHTGREKSIVFRNVRHKAGAIFGRLQRKTVASIRIAKTRIIADKVGTDGCRSILDSKR